jgi:DNA-binding NarL/FixJ family response regulator
MLYDLRPAEVRVFELIAAGISGRGAAEALGISPSTVKTHTVRLFDKLGVHTRAELVRFARDMSLAP